MVKSRVKLGSVILIVTISLALLHLGLVMPLAFSQGNADVTRTKNMQYFEMATENSDVTRFRNSQYFETQHGDVDVTRDKNLDYFELIAIDADLTRYRNQQCFELEGRDADVTRLKNLQLFELAPVVFGAQIGTITTQDQNGAAQTDFNRESIVQFSFTVTYTGTEELINAIVYVQVLDPTSTPVFRSYVVDNILPGQVRPYVFGYGIPLDAAIGAYTVRAMVFTDWPSNGGIGLDIETSAFNVIP
jgi:hypothetical protein